MSWMRQGGGIAAVLALLLTGCSDSDHDVLTPTADESGPQGQTISLDAGTVVSPARWQVRVDPDACTATTTFLPQRQAAENDDLYALSLENFFKADTFKFEQLARNGSRLEFTYIIAHPFAGPKDPTDPASGTNRADLGFTGLVLFLFDVPTATGNTYFTDVIVNTTLPASHDGYYKPGALVPTSLRSNTFPFQTIVHERGSAGSRIGVSNGGTPSGNFGFDGWTRSELDDAPKYTGWTGYGYLHQGQRSRRTIGLNLSALPAGPLEFEVALLAKYQDPRGGVTPAERFANRLPPNPPNTSAFAYRMPHGAWDLQRVVNYTTTSNWTASVVSTATMQFHMEDWDVYSGESTFDPLWHDLDVVKIRKFSKGLPLVAVSVPGVMEKSFASFFPEPDDSAISGGDVAADTGLPGDPLFYAVELTKPAAHGTGEGTYRGLIRFTDKDHGLQSNDPTYYTALRPDLTRIDGMVVPVQTYQSFTVAMAPAPPANQGWATTFGTPNTDDISTMVVQPDGTAIIAGQHTGPINLGGGVRTGPGVSNSFVVAYDSLGQWKWDRTWGATVDDIARDVALAPDGDIWVTGHFDGELTFPSGGATNNGENDVYVVHLDGATGAFIDGFTSGERADERAFRIAAMANGDIVVAGLVDENSRIFGHDIATTTDDPWVARIAPSGGTAAWLQHWPTGDKAIITDLATDPSTSDVLTTGAYYGGMTVEGNDLTDFSPWGDGYLVRTSATGSALWQKGFGDEDGDIGNLPSAILVEANGTVYLAGLFGGTVDYGGGPVSSTQLASDAFFAKYMPDGTWINQYTWGAGGYQRVTCAAWTSGGDLLLLGDHEGNPFLRRTTKGGAQVWITQWFNTTGKLEGFGVGAASDGTLRVGGRFRTTITGAEYVDFDPSVDGELITGAMSHLKYDGWTVKLQNDGQI